MSTQPKIDFNQLNRLVTEGKSTTEIAKFFSCTPGAVPHAKKKLKLSVVKNIALENAHKVAGRNLDAVAQLQKINQDANQMLNELTGENKIIDRIVKAVEGALTYEGDPKKQTAYIRRIVKQISQDRFLVLKAMAEIRGQLNLQLDIFKTLYEMQAMDEFQREVLEAIGETDRDVRDRIIRHLKERRALRQSVSIN